MFLGFLVGGLLMIVIGYSYSYMIAKFQWQVVSLLICIQRVWTNRILYLWMDAFAGIFVNCRTERDGPSRACVVSVSGSI